MAGYSGTPLQKKLGIKEGHRLAFPGAPAQGLALGLVDNKVCAIDETWSALRFVYRVENRPKAKK